MSPTRLVLLALILAAATGRTTPVPRGRVLGQTSSGQRDSVFRLNRWRGGSTAVEEGEEAGVAAAEEVAPTLLQVVASEQLVEHCVVEFTRKTMNELDLAPGDTIQLKGKRRTCTAATVREGKKLGKKGLKVRMSKATMRNLRLQDGQIARVEGKLQPKAAATMTVAAFDDTIEGVSGPEREEALRAYLDSLEEPVPMHAGDHFLVDGVEWKVIALVAATEDGEDEAETTSLDFGAYSAATELEIEAENLDRNDDDEAASEVTYDDVGGSRKALAMMKEMVELPLRHPELFSAVGVPPPHGVLLHGASGTGKTLLAKAVATESGVYVKTINGPEVMSRKSGESESNLRDAFADAKANAPAIILLDEVDSIAPKRDKAGGEVEKRMVSQLLTLMDGLKPTEAVMVIAATNRANVIDPALRRFGRFDREIDMGIPDDEERLEILQVKTRKMKMADDVDLEVIAKDCHGFVGADLAQLCLEAALQAVREQLGSIDIDADSLDPDLLEGICVTQQHLHKAQGRCNPSSLREAMVEVPNVKWADIGGLEDTKRELQETVEYPVQFAEKYRQFGMRPSKGVLFYGPPGCGKTLLAKAIANECKANFLSVKGPELLTMWFGESEANVRNLFDKARAAAPCILFFDEMDSIAKARSGGAGGSGSDAGDRVMNQILAEIDVASSKNVFIIGATNRPDILDTAVTRPGRLDQLIYIPLPDYDSRVSIFKANLRKSPVADDVSYEMLAKVTEGFSGADVTEICQRAAKCAIRDAIAAEEEELLEEELAEAEGLMDAELDEADLADLEYDDPVPAITRAHFEESMAHARKSVPEAELARYQEFAKKMKADNKDAQRFKFKKNKKKGKGKKAAAKNDQAPPTAE